MTDAPAGWDAVAARGPGGHVMQSSAWAKIREAQGWTAEFLDRDGARALVLWRSLPGGMRFGYCPRGPVAAPERLADALRMLAAHAKATPGAPVLKGDPARPAQEAPPALPPPRLKPRPHIPPA